tara:strand:+ start:972 stop:1418 length:447 start_codon:yes stop_codon:yes gene_type:complete
MSNKSLFIIKPIKFDKYLYKHHIIKFINKKKYKLVYLYGNLLDISINLDNYNYKKIKTLDPNFWYPIDNFDKNILLIINKKLIDYSFLLDLLEFCFSVDIIFILDNPSKDNLNFLSSDLFKWDNKINVKIQKNIEPTELENLYDFIYD